MRTGICFSPSSDNGRPRRCPLSTTNTRSVSAEHHRFEHCLITEPATRRQQGVDLGRLRDPRQRARSPDQRDTPAAAVTSPPGRQAPRDRVHSDITAQDEERIQR